MFVRIGKLNKGVKIVGIIILSILFLFSLRFIIGGSEDDWICVAGEWVKHGVPSAPKPTKPCGTKKPVSRESEKKSSPKEARTITEADIDVCQDDGDCLVVKYQHCCGATKRAINREYLEEYNNHPEWQSFFDAAVCARIGVCPDDAQVSQAKCEVYDEQTKRCRLQY